MKRRILLPAIAIGIVAAAGAAAVAVPSLPARRNPVPTSRVTKGPLKLTVHAVGELRAGRTVTLVTPPVGGMLRIVTLMQTGTPVKAGEPVVEFDPADQQYALEQAKSELAEAEQEIVKMKADAAVQGAQDDVALLTARFDVRRARARRVGQRVHRRPRGAEERALARRGAPPSGAAAGRREVAGRHQRGVAGGRRGRSGTKAQLAMQRAQQVIDSLVIKAPFDGVVSLKENRDAAGGMIFWGMVLPEYRAGDQISPGRPVVDVIESGRMEVRAKINESDRPQPRGGSGRGRRGRCAAGRDVQGADRAALRPCEPRATSSSRRASTRLFDVTLQFDQPDQPAQGRRVGARDARRQGSRRTRFTCRGRRCSTRTARTTSSSRPASISSSAKSKWSSAPRAAS